jgi:hypothetical protein
VITVKTVTAEQLGETIRRELDCANVSDALQRATIADHIRAMVYGAWISGSEENYSIHTTRILSNVRRIQRMVWPQDSWEHHKLGDRPRQVLDSLAVLGDVISVGGGYWIPGPTSLVELDGTQNVMVVGGIPSQIAAGHFGERVRSTAAFRHVGRRSILITPAKDILQTIDRWLGYADPIREWTNSILQQHGARLSVNMDIGVEPLEIYAPEIFRDQRKAGRWIRATEIDRALDGLRLCRLRQGTGVFGAPHFLATFNYMGGQLALGRSVSVAADVSRRLRFGFDIVLQTPRQVAVTLDGTQFVFDNSISLPEAEARVLSLAWRDLKKADDDSTVYYFHTLALPLMLRALARLGLVPTIIDRRTHVQ